MTPAIARRARQRTIGPVTAPLRSRTEFASAVAELDLLVDKNPRVGTPEHDRMELLAILVGAYEADNLRPPKAVTPQQLVHFMAEQKGMSAGELAELLGGRSRLSDFNHARRPLSTGQILKLRDALAIPADRLISR
ncbi:MAG: transcriptional regulator [Gemmatimonadales bacterium]